MSRKCSNCGSQLAEDEMFCSKCGTKLTDNQQQGQVENNLSIVKTLAYVLFILGVVGLLLGNQMYGDIGITEMFSGVIALVTGFGFIKIRSFLNHD